MMCESRRQAVWALGNVAGDSPPCRDLVLGAGAMQPLLGQLHQGSKMSMLRNATWFLSNFCRGKPQPDFEMVRPCLATLSQLIFSPDEEVLTVKMKTINPLKIKEFHRFISMRRHDAPQWSII